MVGSYRRAFEDSPNRSVTDVTLRFTQENLLWQASLTFGNSMVLSFCPLGDLLAIQRDSFEYFLQKNVLADERLNCGLQALLKYFFPIKSLNGSFALDIVSYEIDLPALKVDECRQKKLTYGANVKGLFRLFAYDKDGSIIDVREQPAPFFLSPYSLLMALSLSMALKR